MQMPPRENLRRQGCAKDVTGKQWGREAAPPLNPPGRAAPFGGVVTTGTVTQEKRCSGAPCRGTGPLPPASSGPAPSRRGRGSRLRYWSHSSPRRCSLRVRASCSSPRAPPRRVAASPVSRALGPAGAYGLRPPGSVSQSLRKLPSLRASSHFGHRGGARRGRPALPLLGSFGHGAPRRSARGRFTHTPAARLCGPTAPLTEPASFDGRPAATRPRSIQSLRGRSLSCAGRRGGAGAPLRQAPVAQRRTKRGIRCASPAEGVAAPAPPLGVSGYCQAPIDVPPRGYGT